MANTKKESAKLKKAESSKLKTASSKVKTASSKVKKAEPAPAPEPEMPDSSDDAAADMLDAAVKGTPWWAMSLAFHGLVLASLPLFVFSQKLMASQEAVTIIKFTKQEPLKIKDIELSDLRTPHATPGDIGDTKDDEHPTPRFLDAVAADHAEEDTHDPDPSHHGMIGEPTGTSYVGGPEDGGNGRMPGRGNNDAIGPGGGSGTGKKFGNGPFGGRHNLYVAGKHTRTGSAVEFGLIWLARHQSPDGHWSSEGYHAQCEGSKCTGAGLSDFDVGNTALALLGFLGAGYTPSTRSAYTDPVTKKKVVYGEVIQKGIKWLIDHQNADGAIGPQIGEMMYNHAIASLALSEAYGLTAAVSYRMPAQKAINFLVTAQNYGLGWRYTPKCGNNDTSVTGWCVMALKSAQISNLDVPQTSFVGAKAWLDRVMDSQGNHGYDKLGTGEIYVPGKNEKWQHHPSMTAVGLLCRIFIDKKKGDKVLSDCAKIVSADQPKWDPNAARPTVDYYYWYYATLALWQFEGPDGKAWQTWNKSITNALCDHQRTSKDHCLDGSWDTENVDRWAYAGGRVYGTALNVLTLETTFRYELAFGSGKRGEK